MRSVIWLPAAAAALLSLAAPAQAMPVAKAPGFSGEVTFVRDGCGPFGRRSHYGYCKDDRNPEYQYYPEEGRPGGYGGYDGGPRFGGGYGHGPGFYEDGGYRPRRCFIQDTYDGPVRVCR